jgi:hypothetical protein
MVRFLNRRIFRYILVVLTMAHNKSSTDLSKKELHIYMCIFN